MAPQPSIQSSLLEILEDDIIITETGVERLAESTEEPRVLQI